MLQDPFKNQESLIEKSFYMFKRKGSEQIKLELANIIINENSEEGEEDLKSDLYKDWVYLCNEDHKVLKILMIYHDKIALFNFNNKSKPLWYSRISHLKQLQVSRRNPALFQFVFQKEEEDP